MHGLGIDVQHHSPPGLIGRDVTVDVAPFGDSVNFRLKGSIREATPLSAARTVRVGIAFDRLSTSERYMIDVLTWSQVDVKIA